MTGLMSTWTTFNLIILLSGTIYLFFVWRITHLTHRSITDIIQTSTIYHNGTKQYLMPKKVSVDMSDLNKTIHGSTNKHNTKTQDSGKAMQHATVDINVTLILNKMDDTWHWAFIKKRIQDNWEDRVQGIMAALRENLLDVYRIKRKVLVYPGLILYTNFAKYSSFGAPLGELVQWADLISGLHILGHDVVLMYNSSKVNQSLIINSGKYHLNGCQEGEFDFIYTDLLGHYHLSDLVKDNYRYKFRILDNWGTEQQFNNVKYATRNNLKNAWGLRDLHLKQFYTYFGNIRDNSMLGTITKRHVFNSTFPQKKNISVLYGKDGQILNREETKQILPILAKYTEIHMTLPELPDKFKQYHIMNHKVLKPQEYLELVHRAKLVVGAGTPLDGPGVIEAIAAGCIFINPKDGVKNFAKDYGKPNNITITSQHKYAEQSIGLPYVYTVNYNNSTEVEGAILKTLTNPVKPYIPFELTAMGFLLKLSLFLEKQNLCDNKPSWPPVDKMKVKVGNLSISCNEVCDTQGLQCENTFFKHINHYKIFNSLKLNCDTTEFVEEIYAPAYVPDNKQCLLQKDPHLFSCASYLGPDPEISRICPCREHTTFGSYVCNWC